MSSTIHIRDASELLREHQQSVYRRTDHMFAVLMVLQWFAGVIAAVWISPRTWVGTDSTLHPHVVAAISLGAIITALPVFLALHRPGYALTRHVIAVSQMLISALLIHLTGGRIETHFHVFGSLAFLACYRDWRVLISATLVVVVDHLIRGTIWPFSVYGVLYAPIWRSFEHGGWVLFEDIFLIVAIRQSVAEMRSVAEASQAISEVAAELTASQAALRNQTQILESVLTSMGDGVIVASSDGEFLVFNPAAEQILRQGQSDTRPEEWTKRYGIFQSDLKTPYPIQDLPLVRAIRGESTDAVELFIRPSPADRGNWISASGRPLNDSDGHLLGGVVVFRDVTIAKQSEEALREATRIAEAANHSKTQFLANMSHEIRTPLSSILGYTELLRRGIGNVEQRDTYLDIITSSGRHLSTLIDDLLDLSKIEAGRMEFEQIRCAPHQIITEVLSVLRVRAQQKRLRLECSWSTGVPETILTDPARFRQLLMNLVGNAIKFTERGTVSLQATFVLDRPEPRLLIEVSDTGIGIPAERLESIFSPFEQADSSITRRFGGTGLGLAICRHIARGLVGEIVAESRPGQGSTFRVTLSTGALDNVHVLDQPPSEALISRERDRVGSNSQLPACQILLVEDGDSNQQLISLVLEEAGGSVVCAINGEEGVKLATSQRFDLILMDMQMPVMDGYTATRRLRDLGYTLPIVALTAHAMRGDRERCVAAGCSGYLTKPIDIDELISTVAVALHTHTSGITMARANVQRIPYSDAAPLAGIACTLPTNNPRFRPIVEKFVDRLQDELAVMRAASSAADWNTLSERAHWLCGSGGTLGFACFSEPARRLELLAKTGQRAGIQETIDELIALADRIEVPT